MVHCFNSQTRFISSRQACSRLRFPRVGYLFHFARDIRWAVYLPDILHLSLGSFLEVISLNWLHWNSLNMLEAIGLTTARIYWQESHGPWTRSAYCLSIFVINRQVPRDFDRWSASFWSKNVFTFHQNAFEIDPSVVKACSISASKKLFPLPLQKSWLHICSRVASSYVLIDYMILGTDTRVAGCQVD